MICNYMYLYRKKIELANSTVVLNKEEFITKTVSIAVKKQKLQNKLNDPKDQSSA